MTMSPDTPQAADLRRTMENLIQSASSQNFEILDRMYHDDMKIFMCAPGGVVHQSNKEQFTAQVIAKTQERDEPMTWANFHFVEADEKHGHVVVSRKINLTGEMQTITLSIDLIHEDGRWQITREVIATA